MAQLEDKQKEQDMQQQFIYKMGKEAEQRAQNGQPFDPKDPDSMDWYQGKVAQAKAMNLPLPAQPNPSTMPTIINQSNALINDPKFIQKMAEGKQTVEGQKAVETMRANAQRDVATTNAASREEVANTRLQGTMAAVNASLAKALTPALMVAQSIQKGETVNPQLAHWAAEVMVDTELKNTSDGTVMLMKAMNNDKDAQDYKESLVQKKLKSWGVGGDSSSGPAPSSGGVLTKDDKKAPVKVMTKAQYDALKPGDPYIDSQGTAAVKQ
jgi:hypothetical protein